MIQDIWPKIFDNQYIEKQIMEKDYVIAFSGSNRSNDQILIRSIDGQIQLPTAADIGIISSNYRYLFSIDEENYFLCEDIDVNPCEGFTYQPIRCLRVNNPAYICFAGMTAYHIYSWYRDNRFCGRCGERVIHDTKLRMMKCPACGNMIFPKIAPAVIIGVIDGDRILISTYAGREYKGRALLAGFCEIGESPEETVLREVLEEVGLKVKNIRYYKSQPWGFDSNLLLGYFCEVDGSTNILRDEDELASAEFIRREDIPEDSNLLSLTATMIEAFRNGLENDNNFSMKK